ncbi:MAG: glycoside hydrolase family 2 [Haloplasmataceae bacterium]|nr:glycoside hydrolase family 2 [Haloplasmataceae bacterium]
MKRIEYPRPNFVRKEWLNLNGTWDFAFDDHHVGHAEKWYKKHEFDLKIEVPFCFQSELSGINKTDFHDHIWYKRTFNLDELYQDKHIILHVGACDYESEVYINQELVTKHRGGHSSFSVDITNYLKFDGVEEIVIYAFDPSTDEFIPRGKQYWKEKIESIWYTRTTGIWQTVWLEVVEEVHIDEVRMTPDIDKGVLNVEVDLNQLDHVTLQVKVLDQGKEIISNVYQVKNENTKFTLDIFQNAIFNTEFHGGGKIWSPEHPYLFDIEFKLVNEAKVLDDVKSYFGMRKIHQEDGIIYLNNRPYFQKLVLDQGYFEKGLLTAPTDEDYVNDIILSKKMGFNGCRKHQKVSDPRFLYHADRLGYIVWGEMANSANFNFDYVERMVHEWVNVIKRDYNHPCIVTWVPINESWGVPKIARSPFELNHALTMYHLTHSLDHSRLVVSNDGWELTKTDICAIHNYSHGTENEIEKQKIYEKSISDKDNMLNYLPAGRSIYVGEYKNEGEPIMLTEFGGISFNVSNSNGWGYTSVNREESFLKEYKRLIDAIGKSSCIRGFCYTQLTDVFQEVNGLLTFDRKAKVPLDKIKEINDTLSFMIKK